ncbi:MAG: peptidoglycan recognition protein, partial [Actinomycetota bacterium]|nr:peptidoglycan recognition protein [Actinomycetota bacterium]
PVWTGEARCVHVALRLPAGQAIDDVRAVFLNTSGTATEPGFLDRAGSLLAHAWGMTSEPFRPDPASAATVQPPIITRAGWGANEKMRRCDPDYADAVEMAYVHHTVNSNAYSRSRADDLVRGIYAYHVQGRKFCDIAYNFLIDRFGRIYEGRFGGIDQPVIGAHAMGFNTGSTGVAALGDLSSHRPPKRVIKAFRILLAWRLDVAHVRPTGTARMESGGGPTTKYDKGDEVTLPAVSAHKETGYTSCPGRLSTKLRIIRRGAQSRGLPKIWDHTASPNPAPPGTTAIRFTATLSQEMDWTIDIYHDLAPASPYRSYSGRSATIDVWWDRKPGTVDPLDPEAVAPPGTYTVSFRASEGSETARDAVLSLTLQ